MGSVGPEAGDSLSVRPGVEADVEAWLDLFGAVAAEGQWIATEEFEREARRSAFLERLGSDDSASFVALAGEALVGTLGVERRSGDLGLWMLVDKDHRAMGVGSALLEAAIGWAKAKGAHRLSLSVFPHNHAARALYAKYGFVTEGTLRRSVRRRNGELWDVLVMGLVLDWEAPGRLGEQGDSRRLVLSPPERGLRAGNLVLRPGRLADAEALVVALDDPEIHRWISVLPNPFTLEEVHGFLAELRRQWTEARGSHFVITRAGELVGGIGLSFDPRVPRLAEASYWVAREARGAGVATVALRALTTWALGPLGMRRIEIHVPLENIASRKVAEGAGSWRASSAPGAPFRGSVPISLSTPWSSTTRPDALP